MQPVAVPAAPLNPNPRRPLLRPKTSTPLGTHRRLWSSSRTTSPTLMSSSCLPRQSLRYAVLGAGFAGLSVAWNLLQLFPKDLHMNIDIFDEVGVGGGASGVSGGLLHPYSPKVKLLWRGAECWAECLKLLGVAEAALTSREPTEETKGCKQKPKGFIVRRRGIIRPAMNLKNLSVLGDNAQKSLGSCRIETLDKDATQTLVPNLCAPYNSAFYMPEALTIHPQNYLQGLFFACEDLAKQTSTLTSGKKELCMHKKSVHTLTELADGYDAVVICVGARANMLPELSGRLPLRTCRGIIANLQLPDGMGEDYPDESPSILSDVWLAFQDPRCVRMGSTWEWESTNYSPYVSAEETSKALEELLPKASAIYPPLTCWNFNRASAGLRAMPPLTPSGSLPLLGCIDNLLIDNFVSGSHKCRYWLFGGLGARGLLYHGWLGKMIAQAVVSCHEEVIPSELTSWKRLSKRKP